MSNILILHPTTSGQWRLWALPHAIRARKDLLCLLAPTAASAVEGEASDVVIRVIPKWIGFQNTMGMAKPLWKRAASLFMYTIAKAVALIVSHGRSHLIIPSNCQFSWYVFKNRHPAYKCSKNFLMKMGAWPSPFYGKLRKMNRVLTITSRLEGLFAILLFILGDKVSSCFQPKNNFSKKRRHRHHQSQNQPNSLGTQVNGISGKRSHWTGPSQEFTVCEKQMFKFKGSCRFFGFVSGSTLSSHAPADSLSWWFKSLMTCWILLLL